MRSPRSATAFALFALALVQGCSSGELADAIVEDSRAEGTCANVAVSALDPAPESLLVEVRPDPGDPTFTKFAIRSIDADPRPVLESFDVLKSRLADPVAQPVAEPGEIPWHVPMPYRRLADADRVLVVPRARASGSRVIELPSRFVDIERGARGRSADLTFDAADLHAIYEDVRLEADLHAVVRGASTVAWSGEVEPPRAGSWLAFSIGVLDPGDAFGPVRFRLDACAGERCTCLHEEALDPAETAGRGWQARWAPLDGLPDEAVRFRFTAELLAPGPDRAMLGVWELPRLLVPADELPGRHNVVLISLDTLRADHLGAYGYARDTSPMLSGPIREASTLFMHAVAPATATAASHMTLFTSLPPSVHGVTTNLTRAGLSDRVKTLASALQERGFVTGSMNENGALTRRMGFGRGFDYERQFRGELMMSPMGYVREVFRAGEDFIARHRNERFFLFLHTYQVHDPYLPPKAYASLFSDGDAPSHADNVRVGRRRHRAWPVLYDREIRYLDAEVGGLVERLRRSGALDDTIVIITSDHGEAFAEHGFMGHGNDVYDESIRVPLFMMGPGIESGARIEEPVGLIDLMPTVLDLVGVPVPAGLHGRSLAPLLGGDGSGTALSGRVLASENWRHRATEDGEGVLHDIPALALRKGRYKLIRTTEETGYAYVLYDVIDDPGERRDLLGEVQPLSGEAAAVAAELVRRAARYEESSIQAAADLGLPPPEAETFDAARESPERLEALRVLGYIE